jgi:hypothetical protein
VRWRLSPICVFLPYVLKRHLDFFRCEIRLGPHACLRLLNGSAFSGSTVSIATLALSELVFDLVVERRLTPSWSIAIPAAFLFFSVAVE